MGAIGVTVLRDYRVVCYIKNRATLFQFHGFFHSLLSREQCRCRLISVILCQAVKLLSPCFCLRFETLSYGFLCIFIFWSSLGLLAQTIVYMLVGSPMQGDAHATQKFDQTVTYRNNKMRMYWG